MYITLYGMVSGFCVLFQDIARLVTLADILVRSFVFLINYASRRLVRMRYGGTVA